MVAPKWGRITDSHLLKLHLENSTGSFHVKSTNGKKVDVCEFLIVLSKEESDLDLDKLSLTPY